MKTGIFSNNLKSNQSFYASTFIPCFFLFSIEDGGFQTELGSFPLPLLSRLPDYVHKDENDESTTRARAGHYIKIMSDNLNYLIKLNS